MDTMTEPATRRRVRRPADAPPPSPGEWGHAYAAGIERAATRRADMLTRIRTHIEDYQRPPTTEELARTYGLARRAIQDDLAVLRDAGHIEWDLVHGRKTLRIPGHRALLIPTEQP